MPDRSKFTYWPVRQTEADWHELRKGRITASLAAACIGVCPWRSPQSAYRQVKGLEEHVSNYWMEYGREHEPDCVAAYKVQSGNLCRDCGFFASTERPWLGASPDRLVGADGLLEAKCGAKVYSDPLVNWIVQGTVQLYCADRAWVDLCHWCDGATSIWRLDRSLIDLVLPKLDWFRETFILPGRQPSRGEVAKWTIPEKMLRASYVRSV